MDSAMQRGFQGIPPKLLLPPIQDSIEQVAADRLVPSLLPALNPYAQRNQFAIHLQGKPEPHFPLISGLHVSSPTATSETYGPRKNSSSPVHAARVLQYERPPQYSQPSPIQRDIPHFSTSQRSPKRKFESTMAARQNAHPPPPFSTNIYQPPLSTPSTELRPAASDNPMSIESVLNQDSLLSQTPTQPVTDPYTIWVRQQPHDARKCGNGVKDRRHIDPPPVVQMSLRDPRADLNSVYNTIVALHCRLWNADTDTEERWTADHKMQLEGEVSATPRVGPDEHNVMGCFFLFPDLSCRVTGRFRLRFQLSISPLDLSQGKIVPFMAVCFSEVFQVSDPAGVNRFKGMTESTPLTKALKEIGFTVKLRRGAKVNAAKSEDEGEAEDGEEDDIPAKPSTSKRRKSGGKR